MTIITKCDRTPDKTMGDSKLLRSSMLDFSIMEMLVFTAILVVHLLDLTNCEDAVLPNHIPRDRPTERISSFVDTLLQPIA